MFESFLSGVFLGICIAVPFGPINVLILSYALKSFSNAFSFGLGAMSADIAFLFLLEFGVLSLLNEGVFMQILAVFAFCFLTFIAFLMLKAKDKALEFKQKEFKENLLESFTKGFILNALNPYVIGFWLSVAVLFASENFAFFMVAGLFLFIFFWVFSLAFFVQKFSVFFGVKTIKFINISSAILIEYFALSLLYKTFFKG